MKLQKTLFSLLVLCLFAILNNDVTAQKRYSGSKHSSSHGGHYSSGRGSSHKGGHYKNVSTGNRYGRHRH